MHYDELEEYFEKMLRAFGDPSDPNREYVYPDGTKLAKRPDRDQIWVDNRYGSWEWDDFAEMWVKLGPAEKQCECGSEKVGSSAHSTWCAKYEP